MFSYIKLNGIALFEIEEFKRNNVTALFTTRKGGISTENYSSLNIGLHTDDKKENIIKNRKILAEALNLNPENFTCAKQVHGTNINVVKQNDKGKGAIHYSRAISSTDALFTTNKRLPLLTYYADCVPLYFMVPKKNIIGLAHAGWRGTVNKIAALSIDKLKSEFDVNPKNCWAAIGPAISRKNYEVDQNIINKFKKQFKPEDNIWTKKSNNKFLLDLKKANFILLNKAGIPSSQIIVSEMDTFENEELFFSYRRDGKSTGRMASIIYQHN
ncbi:MAG: peptidoglycan editing factor PgeF [Halanaerobiales bacterium]